MQGKCVYQRRDIREIRDYCAAQQETLWNSIRRFENPQIYYVDLSQKLWDVKQSLLSRHVAHGG